MKNQTYLIHSGASMADADTQQWKLHQRSAVNPFDAPLSEAGKERIENVAKNIEQIDVIDCSPMTRSIDSSLILKEKFEVPVRVEYGIAESPKSYRFYRCGNSKIHQWYLCEIGS